MLERVRTGSPTTSTLWNRRVISSQDVSDFMTWLDRGSRPEEREDVAEDSSGAPGSTFFSGYLGDFLSVGGDFRFSNRTLIRGSDDVSTSLDVSEGNLYASVEFLDGALVGYFDETVAPGGAASREAYALIYGPASLYLKAGRMKLPFGLRLQDDSAFIREITGFNYGVQDIGIELGWEPGPFSLSVATSNGTQGSSDSNRDKQVSAIGSFVQRYWRIGTRLGPSLVV